MKGKAKKKNIKKEYNMAVGPLQIIIILVIALLVFGGREKYLQLWVILEKV